MFSSIYKEQSFPECMETPLGGWKTSTMLSQSSDIGSRLERVLPEPVGNGSPCANGVSTYFCREGWLEL